MTQEGEVKVVSLDTDTSTSNPENELPMRAFVSYSWDSEDHKDWVRRFAEDLIRNGVDVTLDQFDLTPGQDRYLFMERGVTGADVVLIVCTPSYVERANERQRGVGVETTLLTPQFFEAHADKQFIPIIRQRYDTLSATPFYLASLVYLDFTEDSTYAESLEGLLRHLFRQPRHPKPGVGIPPNLEAAVDVERVNAQPLPIIAPSAQQLLTTVLESTQEDWEYFDDRGLYVFRDNPELTIHRPEIDFDRDIFHEDWSSRFPDPVAYRSPHEIRWRDTPVKVITLVAVDGFRLELPLPRSPMELTITREQYHFARLINQFSGWRNRYDEYLRRAGLSVEEN